MTFETFDEDLQRAALDPERWPELLHRISRSAGALGAILISEANRIPVSPVSRDLTPLMGRYYGEGWNSRDVRFRGVDLAIRNGAVTDPEIMSAEEMRISPYYQELLKPEGCLWFCSVCFDVAGSPWFLTLQRTTGQEAFTSDEVAKLTTLRRPLHAAASLSHALAFAQVSGMADAFDHLAKPALILDERGLLIRCNGGAKQILDALAMLHHREIRFHDGDNQRSFDSALVQAGLQAQWNGRARNRTALVDASRRVLDVEAVALGDWARYSFTQASFLLFLNERRETAQPVEAVLRDRYGLTPAEIRIATSLATGSSLKTAADLHGVSYQTARSHLKSVFSKTDTNRQSALVMLLAKLEVEKA